MAKRAKQDFAQEWQYFMDTCETDPKRAGTEYLAILKAAKPNMSIVQTIKDLDRILADPDDNSAWHRSAKNFKEAIQFIIHNTIFKAHGLGVVPQKPGRYGKPGMESIVTSVANMISEDIDFDPMTPKQKRIKQIAESYGYSVYLLTESIIAEGVDREILAQWLDHAGITIDSIKGKFQDIDYRRLDMVITKIEDGETIVIQDHHDLSPDDLHRALSFIQREDTNSPIESTEYEIEELARDASILITAYKIIDNVPYGLAFYSLDDPREPRYDDPDDFDGLSDSDLFGDEDELTRKWDEGDDIGQGRR